MTEYEYQVLQSDLRKKLNNNPYNPWKAEAAYEAGIKAAMSILHSFYNTKKYIRQDSDSDNV